MSVLGPTDDNGIPNILYAEVRQVVAGQSVTHECIFTNTFEVTETIQFADHPSSGTLVKLTAWCNTAPMTEMRAERLQRNLQRIQDGYLSRAQTWSEGIGYRANMIQPELEDIQYKGRHS